jgi:hypothetical protein
VAVVAWALGAWLLPALGIAPKAGLDFFPAATAALKPEPLESQRYLLAVVAAVAVAPLALLLARRERLAGALRFAPLVGQLGVAGVVIASLARDHGTLTRYLPRLDVLGTLVIVAVAAVVVRLAATGPGRRVVARTGQALRTRPGEAAGLVLAVLFAAGVASVCLYTDNNATLSPSPSWVHFPFTFEDVYAVSLGRTPLVDYTPQYSTLLSWLAAPVLMLRPPSIGIFTALMASVTTVALSCLYVTFRMVTGGAGRALLLYLPATALGLVPAVLAPDGQTHTIAAYFAAMPLRYAGPLVLLMVTVWAAGRPESRRRAVLTGVVAGATVLMNPEFGVFAVAGAVLATLLAIRADGPWRRAESLARVRDLALGALALLLLFALATLVRSGRLPDPGQLVYYNRQFAAAGFALLPIDHLLGVHALVFGTCAAAAIAGIGMTLLGTVRPGVEGRRSAVLLVYTGVFGFGAFAYFVGRSDPGVLAATFLGWALALAALAWEAVRRLQAGGPSSRAIAPAALAIVAVSVVLGAGAIERSGYVFHQPGRIANGKEGLPVLRMAGAVRVARDCLARGSDTLIFAALPDRIAHDAHVHNWLPYNDPLAIVTHQQLDAVFVNARRHHVTTALVQDGLLEDLAGLRRHGFVKTAEITNAEYVQAPLSWGPVTQVWARRDAPGATRCRR